MFFLRKERGEKDNNPEKHRDEWMYFNSMRGDFMIEYIYIFKDNEWYISECKSIKNQKIPMQMRGFTIGQTLFC